MESGVELRGESVSERGVVYGEGEVEEEKGDERGEEGEEGEEGDEEEEEEEGDDRPLEGAFDMLLREGNATMNVGEEDGGAK